MIDHFHTELQLRAARYPARALLQAMGYRQPSGKDLERLQDVLESPSLGLRSGGFDFHYSSEGFLRSLCSVLQLEGDRVDQEIAMLKADLEAERKAFKPFLWVDTGFRRRSQPLFALAACEGQRYLQFSRHFWRLPQERQLSLAARRVRQHMQQTGGDLGIWGRVQQYWFFYEKDRARLLDCRGRLVGSRQTGVPGQAALRHKSRGIAATLTRS